MILFDPSISLPAPAPAEPTITGHDGASYVLSDGRTFWAPPPAEGATSADIAAEVAGLIANPPAPPEVAQPAREISKLTVRRRLRDLGKEAAFDAALDAVPGARADWLDAQSLRTDDPLFTTHAPARQALVGLTDEELSAVLAP